MTHSIFYKRWTVICFLLLPLFVLFACNGTTNTSSTPEASASEEATVESSPEEFVIERDIVFGPGPVVYPDTQTGLADLSSYRATLTITFDGTRDGQPESSSKTYTMLATDDPQARQWTIETTDLAYLFLAEMDGLEYEKNGEEACIANTIPEEGSSSERLELASFLTGVIGAEEAGSEMVNEIATSHYTFDQRALGEDGLTESTGELWVATEGGYIVKYLLTKKANADYFGEGMEGTLTWDYQVSDVNVPVTFTLPDDCPPGLVDAPMLPDATNVFNLGGVLAYDTSTTLADAMAFYQEQIPTLGWTPQGEPAVTEVNAFLTYTLGDKTMTVIIATTETATEVRILVSKSQP